MTSYEKFIYYIKRLVHNCNHFCIVVRKHRSFFFMPKSVILFFFLSILWKLKSICISLIEERNKFYSNQHQAKQKFACGISERRLWELLFGHVILQVCFIAHNFIINSHFSFKHLNDPEQGFIEAALEKSL